MQTKTTRRRTAISDLVAEKIVYSNYIQSLSQQQQWEIRKIALRLALYYGDWSDALDWYISFVIEDQNTYSQLLYLKDTTANCVKEVINQTSVVYDEPPQRNFLYEGQSDDVAEEIYSNIGLLRMNRDINRLYNLCNDMIVLVDWNPITEKPYLRKLNRTNCEVVTNRYWKNIVEKLTIIVESETDTAVGEMSMLGPNEITGNYKIVWTPVEHYIINYKNEKIAIPGRSKRDDFKNYYGIIPAVYLHKEPITDCFWNAISNQEIIDLMLHIGMEKSLDRFSYWYNSFKMIFLIGEQGTHLWPDKINLSPGAIHKLDTSGGNGKVEIADLMNDFEILEKYKNSNKRDVYSIFGVQLDDYSIQQAQSGLSLKIKNSQLSAVRKEQTPDFLQYEQDLFPIIRVVWNYWKPGDKIKEETRISATFGEPEVFLSSMEKLKFHWHKYQMGLISGATFYMTFNPSVTDTEEAQVKFTENISAFRELFGEPTFSNITEFGSVEDIDEEETE